MVGISIIRRVLLLASAVLPPGHAQTIADHDGQLLAATKNTVAPAAEVETLQLTGAVLANLTAHRLSGIELFRFGDSEAVSNRTKGIAAGSCKVYPGDREWPSALTWDVFNLLTGGALIKTMPIGAVCYPNGGIYNAQKCADIITNWTQSATQ